MVVREQSNMAVASRDGEWIVKLGTRVRFTSGGHRLDGVVAHRYPDPLRGMHGYACRPFGVVMILPSTEVVPTRHGGDDWERVVPGLDTGELVAQPIASASRSPRVSTNMRALLVVEAVLMGRDIAHDAETCRPLAAMVVAAWERTYERGVFTDQCIAWLRKDARVGGDDLDIFRAVGTLAHLAGLGR